MTKNTYLMIFLFAVTAFSYAQSVEVVGKEYLTKQDDGEFYYPRFSNSGESVIFTGDGYKGLWSLNNNGSLRKLNDMDGAGNNPQFDTDDSNIIFRSYRFENLKRVSGIFSQNVFSGTIEPLVEDSKDVYAPVKSSRGNIKIIDNGSVKDADYSLNKSSANQSETTVYIENSKIVIVTAGDQKVIEPLGMGNYLWPSVSPDGSKLLFTKAGSGSFVSDLDGNILYELGRANYPVWAKDGKWVVYMNDKDDGYAFTGSDIEMINLDTMQRFNLTGTEDVIEMYPDYSQATDEVVCHTLNGQILKLKLKFN